MSIINNAHPGSSVRLLNLIDRVISRREGKPISREELIEVCRPESLPGTDTAAKRFEWNLNFWLEEGLWVEEDAGIRMPPGEKGGQALPSRVLSLIIKNNSEADITQGNRTEPLLRTISCLLAQDRYTVLGSDVLKSGAAGNCAEAINNRLPSSMSINVSNEASTMLEYGEFLGFLEPIEDYLIVDPTRAIEPILEEIFSEKNELSSKEFLESLCKCLPMLDGGVYREDIEALMLEKGWSKTQFPQISASLSHALFRLNLCSKLTLDQLSDDVNSISMVMPKEKRTVSIIKYREASL
jgi:hypothetical protein